MITIYRFLISPVIYFLLHVFAIFSDKGRNRIEDARKISRILQKRSGHSVSASQQTGSDQRIHFHVSSVGEFEQARPLIRLLKNRFPDIYISVSFSSPSGSRQPERDHLVDLWTPTPLDTRFTQERFVDYLNPHLVIFVRYDLWPEFLYQVAERNIPMVLVNGVMRIDSARFNRIVMPFFSWLYRRLSFASVVTELDLKGLKRFGLRDISVDGDTRYDQVVWRAQESPQNLSHTDLSGIRNVCNGRTIMVCGSTWLHDERILRELAERNEELVLLIVPHETGATRIRQLEDQFPEGLLLSLLSESQSQSTDLHRRVVIVDRQGLLFDLYSMADLVFVGGGFGRGVHSTLEPAAFGVPIFCGPRIERSRDAVELSIAGLLKRVKNGEELNANVEAFTANPVLSDERRSACTTFVGERTGAAERIFGQLAERRMLNATSERKRGTAW